jgi:hypothetical protein
MALATGPVALLVTHGHFDAVGQQPLAAPPVGMPAPQGPDVKRFFPQRRAQDRVLPVVVMKQQDQGCPRIDRQVVDHVGGKQLGRCRPALGSPLGTDFIGGQRDHFVARGNTQPRQGLEFKPASNEEQARLR